MNREKSARGPNADTVISIIGPGMLVVGDLDTDGTVRVEGEVEGDIRAGKAVVVGKEGRVEGNIRTQDAVLSGTVQGSLTAASRLEVQATARIEGDVHARRIQLEEGAVLNGTVQMGEDVDLRSPQPSAEPPAHSTAEPGSGEHGMASATSPGGEALDAGP